MPWKRTPTGPIAPYWIMTAAERSDEKLGRAHARVLDIDLDFFADGVLTTAVQTGRARAPRNSLRGPSPM
jgi:hypothetical protein